MTMVLLVGLTYLLIIQITLAKADYSQYGRLFMYETFRDEMIYKLREIDPVTLSTVISALDEVACGYTIGKSETALTVIGKSQKGATA